MPKPTASIRFVSLLLVVAVIGAVGFGLLAIWGLASKETRDVIVPRGASIGHVANLLYDEEVIDHPFVFKILLRMTNGSRKLRAGEFRFNLGTSPVSALSVLYFGEPIYHPITIPEGWNLRQIALLLANEGLVNENKFLSLAMKPPQRYHWNLPTYEGLLFPDTYSFSKVDGEERILERMVQRFNQMVGTPLLDEARSKNMTPEKMLILASMIEKETGAPGERELVSSVFWNRLNVNMRLQSDPTTIYGLANFSGRLRKADLESNTPYNTYVIPGLPPGPICNPGLASIVAALRPAATKYFYFVSNNQGGHIFSETYGQHARHVNTYQKQPNSSRHLGRIGN